MANTGDIMATNAGSYDMGRKEGYVASEDDIKAIKRAVGADESFAQTQQTHGSVHMNPQIVKTGDGSWEVKFHMPGPRVIETPFPLPLGKVYYISTKGLVENLRVGRITEDSATKQLHLSPAPASEFCGNKPHLVRQITNVNGARLAFSTELVAPGDYIIKIMEPLVDPMKGTHSHGVALDRWYQ
jgi:hypothetical protein